MNNLIHLGPFDLLVAALLVVAAGGISLALKLGVERRLAIAAVRTIVQLGILGLLLEHIFAVEYAVPVLLMCLIMILFAARESVARQVRRYAGIHVDAFITMALTGLLVTAVVTQAVVGIRPWYDPQYVIPLLGMVLGNSMNAIALSLERCIEHMRSRRAELELMLAYGADRREVMQEPVRTAVRTGMVPIINAMVIVGIVSLPGMMTGQILAGSPPLQAVAYQVVVMYMLATSCALGAMFAARAAAHRLTEENGALRLDRLREKPTE